MSNIDDQMKKSVDAFKRSLLGIRTSRANPDMLNGVTVNYYGSMVPLQQVASISVPENQVFVLNVFDNNALKDVEKGIISANLGLTPMIDGNIIRIRLPDLTEDRRKELVKQAKSLLENAKVAIRNIRRDAIDTVKAEEKNKEITEDESKKRQHTIQSITDDNTKRVEVLLAQKEEEILTI